MFHRAAYYWREEQSLHSFQIAIKAYESDCVCRYGLNQLRHLDVELKKNPFTQLT
jgi:hypothetical protein